MFDEFSYQSYNPCMNRKLLYLASFLILTASLAAASGNVVNELISLSDIVDGHSIPSIACAVIVDNEIVLKDAYGLTRLPDGVPVTTSSRYHIGSNTKAMTAVLASIAVDEGLLGWDSSVADLLSERIVDIPSEYSHLTLTQLLSHSAGVPPTGDPVKWGGYFYSDDSAFDQRTAMVEDIMGFSPLFKAGEGWVYSNFGYIIAGVMIEEAFGTDWETIIETELFNKINMTGTGFGPPAKGDSATQPWGHNPTPFNPDSVGADNPPGLGPAGTIYSTLDDLVEYARLWIGKGTTPGGMRVFSDASYTELVKPRNENYAFGWMSFTDETSGRIITHDGSNTMFYAHFTFLPDSKDAVIILCNSGTQKAVEAVYELRAFLMEEYF